MRFKILPRLLLAIGVFALALIFNYRESIRDLSSFNIQKLRIYIDNFFYEAGKEPSRRRPVSLLNKETELKLYIGAPFRDFTRSEWDDFWNLIYGGFPKEEPERKGLPKRNRQLTLDEIASELAQRYPSVFAYFKEKHWRMFFGLILEK